MKIFSLLLYFLFANYLLAYDVFVDKALDEYNLSQNLEIFIDKTRKTGIEDIQSGKYDKEFKKNNQKNPNYGIQYDRFWIRLQIENLGNKSIDRFIEYSYPLIDVLDFYVFEEGKNIQTFNTGDMRNFSSRGIETSNFVFPLHIEPNHKQTLYFMVESKGSIQIPISIWKKDAFIEADEDRQIFLGAYYGTLAIMFLYNLFLFFIVRDFSYFFYIIYILGYFFFQSNYNGMVLKYILPEYPELTNILMPFSIGMTLFFASLFSMSFLQTKNYTPFMHKVLYVVLLLNFFVMFLSPFVDYKPIVTIATASAFPFILSVLTAAFIVLKKGFLPARYFIFAWTSYLLGMAILSGKQFGIFPVNNFTTYSIQFGSAIEVTLLSLGLGYRINTFIQQRNEARLEQLKLERKSQVIESELLNARKIQELLISKNTPNNQYFSTALYYQPAHSVGGDICGFQELEEGKLGAFIADVSGHGIPAALLSLLIKQQFDYFSIKGKTPKDILEQLNIELFERLAGHFVTFFYCQIQNSLVQYVNAGHNPPILYKRSSEEYHFLRAKGKPLGIFHNNSLEAGEILYTSGDRLVLYTDGVTEAGEEKDQFGEERLVEVIKNTINYTAIDALDLLKREIILHAGNNSFDDMAIMIIDMH